MIFKAMEILPNFANNQQSMMQNWACKQENMLNTVDEKIDQVSSIVATRSAIRCNLISELGKKGDSILASLMIVAGDIKKILLRLKILSKEFSDQVVANA